MERIDLHALRERPYELLQSMEQMARIAAAGTGFATALQAEWIGVGFSIDGRRFVAPRADVREILQVPNLTQVPGAKGWLLGLSNVRGQLLTVVDLKDFLIGQRSTRADGQLNALVINSEEVPSALVVDEVLGFRRFAEADRVDAPPELDGDEGDYVVGAFMRDDEVWGIFSLNRLTGSPAFLQAAD